MFENLPGLIFLVRGSVLFGDVAGQFVGYFFNDAWLRPTDLQHPMIPMMGTYWTRLKHVFCFGWWLHLVSRSTRSTRSTGMTTDPVLLCSRIMILHDAEVFSGTIEATAISTTNPYIQGNVGRYTVWQYTNGILVYVSLPRSMHMMCYALLCFNVNVVFFFASFRTSFLYSYLKFMD